MHTLVEVPMGANAGTHVPAFLAKLWKIVDDPRTNDLIGWTETGNSFTIKNQARFARDLLPLYYKHNNMASFVRQLNMYGFHKVVSVEQGGLRVDKDEMEFAHPFFLKGQEASLELIKRKIPASKQDESRLRPDSFNKVLLDVRQMKGRQETMDNKLVTMRRENEALWRELASLRQKHAKQTQIVSKLLQFLVGMMSQQTPRLGFKRRMPLMLNDKDGSKQKLARTDTNEPSGPVIHDVTELFEPEEYAQELAAEGQVDDSLNIVASMAAKVPFAEQLVGRISPETLFAIDPSTCNIVQPSAEMQLSTLNAKPKQKPAAKKVAPTAATVTSLKNNEPELTFANPQTFISAQNISQPQMVEMPIASSTVPATSLQTDNTVPTTLYFSAPGMSEPVQVVLSIPSQTATTVSSSGNSNIIPDPASTSAFLSKPLNIQQQTVPPTSNNNGLPAALNNSDENYERNDFDGHLDEVEAGLNNLRDLFKSNEFSVDGHTLTGVSTSKRSPFFNLAAIDPQSYMQLFDGSHNVDNTENQGNQNQKLDASAGDNTSGQMVAYNPSLLELTEDESNFFDDSSNMFLDDELESMLTTDRDSLKRPDSNRSGGPFNFSGVNLNNSYDTGLLSTPTVETFALPGTSAASGGSKRKRK